MLGDQAEKTKNPLKSAMRRRKAKTVTFTAPTYVDYSEIEYSTEEEDGEDDGPVQRQVAQQKQNQTEQQAAAQKATTEMADEDESARVEPLRPRGQKLAKIDTTKTDEKTDVDENSLNSAGRSSDEMFEGKPERVSKNGTVRNTDSFFRDESIETKKITLTPGLLRDDNEPRGSSDSKEVRQRPSLDRLEKELVPDKVKDDKKKKDKKDKDKDKKPSGIRSFFSRKDRKKSIDDDDDSFGKRSMDMGIAEAEESRAEAESSPDKSVAPQRNASKLLKLQQRSETSPTRKPALITTQLKQPNTVENVPPASSSLRMVESESLENVQNSLQKDNKSRSIVPKTVQLSVDAAPQKVTRAKTRVELDDFDSSQEEEAAAEPNWPPPETQQTQQSQQQPREEQLQRPTLPGSYPDSYLDNQTSMSQQQQQTEPEAASANQTVQQSRTESPDLVSPLSPTTTKPPPLITDTSSQEDRSSPISSPSPEPADADERTHRNQDSIATSTSATTTSTWNDSSLRAFFDSGSEIRDLLTVVYDKSDIPPAGPEHPVVGLFREPNAKLAEITTVSKYSLLFIL